MQPSDMPAGAKSSGETVVTPGLVTAVLEIERHVAAGGWDLPARLYALVDTDALIANQPELAEMLGVEPGEEPLGTLTPIEQEELAPGEPLEELLTTIVWPESVDGCVGVIERLVLPPEVDDEVPSDPDEAAEFARTHPLRQEVRMVAGVLRSGEGHCALRLRSHDDDLSVVDGTDLVPGLLDLLRSTFDDPGEHASGPADHEGGAV